MPVSMCVVCCIILCRVFCVLCMKAEGSPRRSSKGGTVTSWNMRRSNGNREVGEKTPRDKEVNGKRKCDEIIIGERKDG